MKARAASKPLAIEEVEVEAATKKRKNECDHEGREEHEVYN